MASRYTDHFTHSTCPAKTLNPYLSKPSRQVSVYAPLNAMRLTAPDDHPQRITIDASNTHYAAFSYALHAPIIIISVRLLIHMSRRLIRICCAVTSCPTQRVVDYERSNTDAAATSATWPARRGKAFPDLDLDYRKPDSESNLAIFSSSLSRGSTAKLRSYISCTSPALCIFLKMYSCSSGTGCSP